MTTKVKPLVDMIAAKAREYAGHYSQSSDGRNTFLIFAEWVESIEPDDPATIRAEALREAHDAIADYPRVAPDGAEAQHYDEQIEYSQSIILALIDKEQGK